MQLRCFVLLCLSHMAGAMGLPVYAEAEPSIDIYPMSARAWAFPLTHFNEQYEVMLQNIGCCTVDFHASARRALTDEEFARAICYMRNLKSVSYLGVRGGGLKLEDFSRLQSFFDMLQNRLAVWNNSDVTWAITFARHALKSMSDDLFDMTLQMLGQMVVHVNICTDGFDVQRVALIKTKLPDAALFSFHVPQSKMAFLEPPSK